MLTRLANEDDLESLYALGVDVDEFEVNEETIEFWPKPILTAAIDSPDVVIAIAENGRELVGFVIANINPTLKKALIENLFVAPRHRGLGAGSMLVRYLCRIVVEEYDCSYIATLVPPDAEGALQTYQQAGFTRGHTFVWLDKLFSDDFSR